MQDCERLQRLVWCGCTTMSPQAAKPTSDLEAGGSDDTPLGCKGATKVRLGLDPDEVR